MIKNNINRQLIPNINTNIEHLIIKVSNWVIIKAHNNITRRDLHSMMSLGNRLILLGDLNSKHSDWDSNCMRKNVSGNVLQKFADYNVIIH